ncbi:uncharacterized protein LACBIDRAFT_334386 [Laccaria bicolor S238N-H82]|uniref:Predicted protein n=1 Tax=Laccaria bicolor (strain S238N-H82 / ATCC MYA-4686) TaxID=486041 RepID=B0DZ20_LACBS|nr:uncharacterized protein LACBIDRAFT_334386 [Laccaria bicolor S238N-H82]EDR00155.1 predicted protein [Laccaria bicolor S238N-H82]|eukprot:XP_001889212.1 predicted protein [Laccaria bicolor S238N-H82]
MATNGIYAEQATTAPPFLRSTNLLATHCLHKPVIATGSANPPLEAATIPTQPSHKRKLPSSIPTLVAAKIPAAFGPDGHPLKKKLSTLMGMEFKAAQSTVVLPPVDNCTQEDILLRLSNQSGFIYKVLELSNALVGIPDPFVSIERHGNWVEIFKIKFLEEFVDVMTLGNVGYW